MAKPPQEGKMWGQCLRPASAVQQLVGTCVATVHSDRLIVGNDVRLGHLVARDLVA